MKPPELHDRIKSKLRRLDRRLQPDEHFKLEGRDMTIGVTDPSPEQLDAVALQIVISACLQQPAKTILNDIFGQTGIAQQGIRIRHGAWSSSHHPGVLVVELDMEYPALVQTVH